jgi:transaldolase
MNYQPNPRIRRLQQAGVSIWLDSLSRDLLESGHFGELIRDYAVTGATSNPTIFAKAITGSERYDRQLRELAAAGVHDPQEVFFTLALDDLRRAAHELREVYDASSGRDGFVSFECTPDLADDAEATVSQALDLWARLDEPNAMIKVPATDAGLVAIKELTRLGVNVNVTLLFAIERYEQVIDAYIDGLTARAEAGEPVYTMTSVASFFVSRIDTKVDRLLPPETPLRGRVAIANARVAYQSFQARFSGPTWDALQLRGATPQRPLWASTGTKDPSYSDVLYVEELIGPDVINTMPEATLHAFAGHGRVGRTVDADVRQDKEIVAAARKAGIDLPRITEELERAGVRSFCDSYGELLACIEGKLASAEISAPSA